MHAPLSCLLFGQQVLHAHSVQLGREDEVILGQALA